MFGFETPILNVYYIYALVFHLVLLLLLIVFSVRWFPSCFAVITADDVFLCVGFPSCFAVITADGAILCVGFPSCFVVILNVDCAF